MVEVNVYFREMIRDYTDEKNDVSGKDEFEIYTKFYNKIDKDNIIKWVNETYTSDSMKDDETARKLRENGNRYYQDKRYNQALEAYTESICYSRPDMEHLSLAYANRSVVFFALNDIKNCLKDIENSLEANYPASLKHKLYLRKANCYLKLGKREDTIQAILKIRQCVNDKIHGLSGDKIDTLLQEILDIERCVELPLNKVNISETCMEETSRKIPKLRDGENEHFLSASAAISLKYNEEKGRHVVANRKLKMGDVIFFEKPFAFVPVFETKKEYLFLNTKCYHCFKLTQASIPCEHCITLFCCKDCRATAWKMYHRWECPGSCINLWTSLGIAYIALRLLLLGASSGFDDQASHQLEEHVKQFGDATNNYKYVLTMATNINKIDSVLKMNTAAIAVTLKSYLSMKTSFFSDIHGHPNLKALSLEQLEFKVGGLLMRHLLQVRANCSALEDVNKEFIEKLQTDQHLTVDGYYVRAAGLFVSVSMMNHSCDPNITSYFFDDCMVVRARRDIEQEEEIYNCYGYDYRHHETEKRKWELLKQYYFDCNCNACTYPTKPEVFRYGLLCQKCQGCAIKYNTNFKCLNCDHIFCPKNHFIYVIKAEKFLNKYTKTGDINSLLKCKELQDKVLYKFNYLVYQVYNLLCNYYSSEGGFDNWWKYAKLSLEMDAHFFKKDSLQYAINMRQILYKLMNIVRNLSLTNINHISKRDCLSLVCSARDMMKKIKKTFPLYYPEHVLKFNVLQESFEDMCNVFSKVAQNNLFMEGEKERQQEEYDEYISSLNNPL